MLARNEQVNLIFACNEVIFYQLLFTCNEVRTIFLIFTFFSRAITFVILWRNKIVLK